MSIVRSTVEFPQRCIERKNPHSGFYFDGICNSVDLSGDYCNGVDFFWRESRIAATIPAAFVQVSSSSRAGLESATIPPPTWNCHHPMAQVMVRMAIFQSMELFGVT